MISMFNMIPEIVGIPVGMHRSVENRCRCRLHSIRNASCVWIAFLPGDAILTDCFPIE
jgi:hypothetical protein